MKIRSGVGAGLCVAAFSLLVRPCWAEAEPATLLAGIRKRVAADHARLPNYTCKQTIERSTRPNASKKWTPVDSLRLEVALVAGRELYAWPGSPKFEEKRIDELVGTSGAIGTGVFALQLRNLFLAPGPKFFYAGEAQANGRRAVRFNFEVPREKSGFEVGDGQHGAVVAYAGSFLADSETLELIRLDIQVDEVPAPVRVRATRDSIEYAKARIGESDFLLPALAEMIIIAPDGDARNITRFDACRQYVGESVVSFGDAPSAGAEAVKPFREVGLPAGLAVEMTLETQITPDAAVGDPVEGVLTRPLKGKDAMLLLPKGARFTGRITRLERRRAGAVQYGVIGVTFGQAEAPGLKAQFHGELESVGIGARADFHVPYYNGPREFNIWSGIEHVTAPPQPDEGIFYVRQQQPRTGRSLRMLWRTTQPQ
ncbi:MAG TPA: hypothetical protein VN428_23770 [Bryobacteraceae bacterium]|nr:hypothetical protein [Bryobacteraceae bacterium]